MIAEVVVDVLNALPPRPPITEERVARKGRFQLRTRETTIRIAPQSQVSSRPQAVKAASKHQSQIKLLDLLTNRYHTGVIHQQSAADIYLELPATSKLHAGQYVRFVVTGDVPSGLIQRQEMNRGYVTQVLTDMSDRLHIRLALTA